MGTLTSPLAPRHPLDKCKTRIESMVTEEVSFELAFQIENVISLC